MSLNNGFRIAVDGNEAVMLARGYEMDDHGYAKVVLVEFVFEGFIFDTKEYDVS